MTNTVEPGHRALNQRLGQLLVADGLLNADKLEHAIRLQAESGQRIGAVLVQLGYISGAHLAGALAAQYALQVVEASVYPDRPLLGGRVSGDFLTQAQMVALDEDEDTVVLAVADPSDSFSVTAIELATGKQGDIRVGVSTDIDAANQRYAGVGAPGLSATQTDDDADIQQLRDSARGEPAIKFVNELVGQAVRMRASDIHLEPYPGVLKVRARVDGVLRDLESPDPKLAPAIVSRIKVLSRLNIAERRLPQDGRMRLPVEGRQMDLRVSTLPTMNGESVVLRLLDQETVPLNFASIGFDPLIVAGLERLLSRPHGIVLVTGPTGSGKTTTLYAALQQLNSADRKVVTVEDPVEYQIQGISQIQVRPAIGLGFAESLRSILRHDPDVIMIGEMRDLETAQIAIQSALTGHKVFSTLHTNDAAGCVTRLLDMGLESYLLTATISGILAQRLVRKLCEACKRPVQMSRAMLTEVGIEDMDDDTNELAAFEAVGCAECDDIGYRGRTTIAELLNVNSAVRGSVLAGADADVIRQVARREGMRSMQGDGLAKVAAGITSVTEVARVTLGT
ncbi:MAG: Flp pilus assembly complex ATPase component TadA [Chromatiales bacterium]|jgi:general secretion pathway protein E|nr:Flp pilus assembly complex ATPase component TadA [Chromatiales bacterium]